MTNRKWTEEEIKFLQDHYQIYGVKKIARMLNRTVKAIHARVSLLKIKKFVPYRKARKLEEIFQWDLTKKITGGGSQK